MSASIFFFGRLVFVASRASDNEVHQGAAFPSVPAPARASKPGARGQRKVALGPPATGSGEKSRRGVRGGQRERAKKLVDLNCSLFNDLERERACSTLFSRASRCVAPALAARESSGRAYCLPRGHRGGESGLHGWSGGGKGGRKERRESFFSV